MNHERLGPPPFTLERRTDGMLHTRDCDYSPCRGECSDEFTKFNRAGERIPDRAALRSQPIQEPRPDLREAAEAVLTELDIIRADGRGATYPRLMVHIDTHRALRAALVTPVPADDTP
jgi:hypothetical protein